MRIFLAFPFTFKLQGKGLLPGEYILELTQLKKGLEKMGHTVKMAHEREKWGEELLPPEICTKLDFDDISKSDLVVAYPGNPPSGGVHIELGWASALGKQIIIIKKNKDSYSPLVLGLHTVAPIKTVTYESLPQLVEQFQALLAQ